MPGRAAVAMWWDIPPEVRAEWEHWHTTEHMSERLGIPGFLRGSRWVAGSSYFVLYEARELATLTTGAYVDRLNDPTPWSLKMMPHHRNMVRSLCVVRARIGAGLGHAMATVRFTQHALPHLAERKGVTSMQLLESQPATGAQTTEQKIRGGDAQADRVLLVCGYDVGAVQAAASGLAPPGAVTGLYRLAYCLTSKDSE
ncbi:MAG TPA: hypothetical protein VGI18_11785 [Burkholderiales bacterium]|jgi:hypothetical protein